MERVSAEEFKKKYGEIGYSKFGQGAAPKKPSFVDRTKTAFTTGLNKAKEGLVDASKGQRNPISTGLQIGAGLAESAVAPITAAAQPIVSPAFDKVFTPIVEKLSSNPEFQKFADSQLGQFTARRAEDVVNATTIADTIGGGKATPRGVSTLVKAGDKVTTGVKKSVQKVSPTLKNAANDVVPTKQKVVSSAVTQALELTPGDVKNITRSTGNDVGQFMSANKLIGNNVDNTKVLLNDFYKTNHKTVRDEIAKVKINYNKTSVPRYEEALLELKKSVDKVAGMQETSSKVNQLLRKPKILLADVQEVKELIDDHFSLYKVTGDVKEGVTKEGLTNIRRDLRKFIETEVKKNSGADIGKMNNNVSTAKSILGSIDDRASRGLTRSNIGLKDLGAFGSGTVVGGPVGGLVMVMVLKIAQSPTIKLRLAKLLDSFDDAKLNQIKNQLDAGSVPDEIMEIVESE